MNGGVLNPLAEKYEGQYVVLRNVITSDRDQNTGRFKINDLNGNSMFMWDQSGYFTKRTHRLTGLQLMNHPLMDQI